MLRALLRKGMMFPSVSCRCVVPALRCIALRCAALRCACVSTPSPARTHRMRRTHQIRTAPGSESFFSWMSSSSSWSWTLRSMPSSLSSRGQLQLQLELERDQTSAWSRAPLHVRTSSDPDESSSAHTGICRCTAPSIWRSRTARRSALRSPSSCHGHPPGAHGSRIPYDSPPPG